MSLSVLNNFELCYRGTSFKVQGGSVIAAFFLAHNYVSEQFGNYVEYGKLFLTGSMIVCSQQTIYLIWRVLCLRASAGRDFFFLMTLRVPLIHYVDISRRHSHKCVCTIMVINVQNQQFSASPNSSNVTNLAKRSEFC